MSAVAFAVLAVLAMAWLVLAVAFGALYFRTRDVADLWVAAVPAIGSAAVLTIWLVKR